jgi:uncharacterized membrane protein
MELWITAALLFILWFILSVLLHKSGMVHILLLSAIAVFVVQLAAYRKAKYHKNLAGR